MVLHEHQHMVVFGQAQQGYAQQRPLLQIERLRDLSLYPTLQVRLIDLLMKDGHSAVFTDYLEGLPFVLMYLRSQAFMTGYQTVETALQSRMIQPATQAQGAGYMVGRTVRIQLPEKPLALLGIRQRQRLLTADRQDLKHNCL